MVHCGVDLYGMSVPTNRTTEQGAHYVTDSSDRPKSLRLMFDAPFYLAFPDLSHPPLGDSDTNLLHGRAMHLVGYHRYHDAKLAWLHATCRCRRARRITAAWASCTISATPIATTTCGSTASPSPGNGWDRTPMRRRTTG